MKLFGKTLAEFFGMVRSKGQELFNELCSKSIYADRNVETGPDREAESYTQYLQNLATGTIVNSEHPKPSQPPSAASNTVIRDQSGIDTMVASSSEFSKGNSSDSNIGNHFEATSSRKIEFKTKSYINSDGLLTTDLIFPDEQMRDNRKPYHIVKTYEGRGIQCNVVPGTTSPAIVRFTGKEAAKLQKDKSMSGRLKLKARSQENDAKIEPSQTLKVQRWKTNIYSKTGQFYAALPLGNERSLRTQKILRDLRDIGIKPVKQKDSKGQEHMLISGENAAKLFNAGLFGSGLGSECFDLTPSEKALSERELESASYEQDPIAGLIPGKEEKPRLPVLAPVMA